MNSYIDNTLNTVKALLLEGYITRLVMVIKDDAPLEKFVFSLDSYYKTTPRLYCCMIEKVKFSMFVIWNVNYFSGKFLLNLTEIKHQARTIWLTINQKFISDTDYTDNCTFTFEIHTRNVAYEKILERQTTEVFFSITTTVIK